MSFFMLKVTDTRFCEFRVCLLDFKEADERRQCSRSCRSCVFCRFRTSCLRNPLRQSSFFFFQTTAQLQYIENSEPVTRSTWPLVNSAKTELQVQKELDKKRFITSAPHGRGATPYTENSGVPGYDLLRNWILSSSRYSAERDRCLSGKYLKFLAL